MDPLTEEAASDRGSAGGGSSNAAKEKGPFPASQQYFSLTPLQQQPPAPTSEQCFSLTPLQQQNSSLQHQPNKEGQNGSVPLTCVAASLVLWESGLMVFLNLCAPRFMFIYYVDWFGSSRGINELAGIRNEERFELTISQTYCYFLFRKKV